MRGWAGLGWAPRGRAGRVPALRGWFPRGLAELRGQLALGCVLGVAGALAGQAETEQAFGRPFVALQLNLCNSGMAGCFTGGRAVSRAVDLVREEQPDLITLVEVCRSDVADVERAMRGLGRDGGVVSTFRAAGDRPSAGSTRCTDGQEFGIGLVVRVPAPHLGHLVSSGRYAVQDPADPEIRVWACVVTAGRLRVCVTHLAAIGGDIALAQCRELLSGVLGDGALPVVLAGDFNLGRGGRAGIRDCLPSGTTRVDDGGVQYVLAGPGVAMAGSRLVDVRRTTDHPGLLATLTLGRAAAG